MTLLPGNLFRAIWNRGPVIALAIAALSATPYRRSRRRELLPGLPVTPRRCASLRQIGMDLGRQDADESSKPRKIDFRRGDI